MCDGTKWYPWQYPAPTTRKRSYQTHKDISDQVTKQHSQQTQYRKKMHVEKLTKQSPHINLERKSKKTENRIAKTKQAPVIATS